MLTTKSVRSRAARISAAVLEGYKPERTEVVEMAQTIVDALEVFKVQYPAIFALKKCVDARGNVAKEYATIWNDEVVPAVKALHAFKEDQ